MAITDVDIRDWQADYGGNDTNVPTQTTNTAPFSDEFRAMKTVVRSESLTKSWESPKGFKSPTGAWTGGIAFAYVAATQFSMTGDQTTGALSGLAADAYAQVGRRVRATLTGGLVHGTVSSASYDGGTGLTTVTLAMDGSDALDNTLSDVQFAAVPTAVSSALQTYGTTLAGDATNTYTATVDPRFGSPSSLLGTVFTIQFVKANTGAATLNLNSIGAISLKKNLSVDIATGDIGAGSVLQVVYDGTNFQILPGAGLMLGGGALTGDVTTTGAMATSDALIARSYFDDRVGVYATTSLGSTVALPLNSTWTQILSVSLTVPSGSVSLVSTGFSFSIVPQLNGGGWLLFYFRFLRDGTAYYTSGVESVTFNASGTYGAGPPFDSPSAGSRTYSVEISCSQNGGAVAGAYFHVVTPTSLTVSYVGHA